MNRVTLTGRLTKDPQLREPDNGQKVCELRIAVPNAARANATGYFDVLTYGPGGEAAARTLAKGWLVAIDGQLEYREWKQNDTTRSAIRIVAHVEFLAAPRTSNGE